MLNPLSSNPDGDESVRSTLNGHAVDLSKHGIGPISRMCTESIFHSEQTSARMPQIHAEEGAKFSAMARRIAPTELVAQHVSKMSAVYPIVARLDSDHVSKAFDKVFHTTNFSGAGLAPGTIQHFQYSLRDSHGYFEFCSRDPHVLLACFYLSLTLQNYADTLKSEIKCPHMGAGVAAFGKQFNASNLVTALPAGLCISLLELRGEQARTSQIDREVIEHALVKMHNWGQFEIRGKGRPGTETAGAEIALKCPMEGYLYELLCGHEVLQPIIAGIDRMISPHPPLQGVTRFDGPLLRQRETHSANADAIRAHARRVLLSFP